MLFCGCSVSLSLEVRLASQVGVPDVVEQDLMHHVVEHVSDGGFELAVQWLHSSFAAEIVHERPSQEAITAQDLGTTAVMPGLKRVYRHPQHN